MHNYAQMGKRSQAAQRQRKRFRRGRFSRKNRRKDTAKKILDILKTQDCEPSLIMQLRALERSGLSAAPAARAAPSIDKESPPQDINRTPEQCSTGFEWSNKSSTPVDSEIEAWSASSPPCSASEDNEFAQFEPSTSVSSLIKEATERLLHTHETNTEWKS